MTQPPLRVYIAGPYRAATPEAVDANIATARDAMATLLKLGHIPFCPHTMTAAFERHYPEIPDEAYLETDLVWLEACDAIVMVGEWRASSGATAELERARELGLRVFLSEHEIPQVDGGRPWRRA